MPIPNPNQPLEATLIQRYPHPISLVYELWVTPRHLERWLSPADDIVMRVIEFNFREGGEYFFRYTWGENNIFPLRGRFLTIKPEQSLIFTWLPQPPDPDAGKDTMVSIWFRPLSPRETEVEVRHTLFPDGPMRVRHQEGWTGAFNRLRKLLASPEWSREKSESPETEDK
jgi:uncharacterized protein YndB with AHSA1/START domain